VGWEKEGVGVHKDGHVQKKKKLVRRSYYGQSKFPGKKGGTGMNKKKGRGNDNLKLNKGSGNTQVDETEKGKCEKMGNAH